MKRKLRRRKTSRPRSSEYEALEAALNLHRTGQLVEAKQAYEKVLQDNPDCVDALYLLGVLSHRIGKPDKAITMICKAIELRPEFPEAQNDLGNMLHEAGKLEKAASVFRKLIQFKPQHADAYNNLGVVLKDQGKHAEAVTAFKKAIELNPKNAGQHYNLGNTLKKLDRLDEAVEAFRCSIELEPKHINAHQGMAGTLRRAGRLQEAQEAFRHWLREDPENSIARHMLNACSEEKPPPRASNEYVRQVFDRFASTFDEDLRELGYKGPQVLAAAITEELGHTEKSLDILDAGCGTGLCGPLLRRYARTLVGVDLSPAMLDRARRLNVYDELVTAELTTYLNDVDATFDLIASTDTMNYFGVLEPVLVAVAGALRDGGAVVFTCEEDASEHSQFGYRLSHHGRYCHTIDYLKKCLAEAGLTIHGITSAVLRLEDSLPVEGVVVRARKGATR